MTETTTSPAGPEVPPDGREPVPWPVVLAIAALTTAVLLALASRYGIHRDEYYYLAGGRRLSWGFPDHPPLTPLVARFQADLFGTSVTAFRVVPSVLAGVAVVIAALIARELGGRRWAQIAAAATAALLPAIRAPHFLFGTTSTDQFFWAVLVLLAAVLLRTRQPRWWLAIGAVAGIGLLNKHTVLFVLLLLVGGLLLTPDRSLLWRWEALAGGAIAGALWAPHIAWQMSNDLPGVEFAQSISEDNGGALGGLPDFVLETIAIWAVVGLVLAWWGLRWLLGDPGARRWRALGIGTLLVFPLVALAGGKAYYAAPLAFVVVPAACVAAEALADRRRTLVVMVVVAGVLSAPLTLPLLPEGQVDAIADVNREFSEMVGWEELPHQVRAVYDELSPDEQRGAVIFTGDYSEAGVLALRGPDLGLPPVYSGHNGFAAWGPPPEGSAPVIVVGLDPASPWCRDATTHGVVTNEAGVENEEAGDPLWVCHELTAGWKELWPDLTHLD